MYSELDNDIAASLIANAIRNVNAKKLEKTFDVRCQVFQGFSSGDVTNKT